MLILRHPLQIEVLEIKASVKDLHGLYIGDGVHRPAGSAVSATRANISGTLLKISKKKENTITRIPSRARANICLLNVCRTES